MTAGTVGGEFVTLGGRVQHEDVVKKSRFICALVPVESHEQATQELAVIKKQHYNATHNCSAMVIGAQREFERASDDGEPQGTAGVPMLDVLKKSGVTNILAVVTRYFGGTLLGAGGLARAYGGGVANTLKKAQLIRNIPAQAYVFHIDYADYGKLCQIAAEYGATPDGEFMEAVTARLVLPTAVGERFRDKITQAFMGADVYRIAGDTYIQQKHGEG